LAQLAGVAVVTLALIGIAFDFAEMMYG
jgi:hypothetical protein